MPYIATLSHFNSPHCNMLSYSSLQHRLTVCSGYRDTCTVNSGGFMNGMWESLFHSQKSLCFAMCLLSASTFFVVYIPVCHQVMGCASGWMEHTKLDGQGCCIRGMKCSAISCLLQAHTHVQYACTQTRQLQDSLCRRLEHRRNQC